MILVFFSNVISGKEFNNEAMKKKGKKNENKYFLTQYLHL
jgi:hypothetical protein